MRYMTRFTAISLCLLGMSPSLYAWGPKGHRIVALVAEGAAATAMVGLRRRQTDDRRVCHAAAGRRAAARARALPRPQQFSGDERSRSSASR
jgi:hypothetical protein